MDKTQYKNEKRVARHKRLRAKVVGSSERPRLSVFRSNRFIYAQLIDDSAGRTIASADSRKSKGGSKEAAEQVGKDISELAKKAGVSEVVFDRGGFRYQGSIAILADSARAGGLKF